MASRLPPKKYLASLHAPLEALYDRYNRPEFISPDPLEVLSEYARAEDREIAGLVSASLAFGTVKQILVSVRKVLQILGPVPSETLRDISDAELHARLDGFRHRYVAGDDMSRLLVGIRAMQHTHGSLGAAFAAHLRDGDEDILPALERFARELRQDAPPASNYLIPAPELGSACKRWHMYLRWMVRNDAVDPGCWSQVPARLLLVPIDTHMHRVALRLRLTRRPQADIKTAQEITRAFRYIVPDDPARYDFALTRLGIRKTEDAEDFFAACGRSAD